MKWNNTAYSEIYDKNNNLVDKFEDDNIVVNQGLEIIRDCLKFGNKLTSLQNIHPVMTSNVLPYPYVVTSNGSFPVGSEFMAFDEVTGSNNSFYATTIPAELGIQLDKARTFDRYSLRTDYVVGGILSSWVLKGSDNGSDWTDIDTQTHTLANGVDTMFALSSPVTYKYVKFFNMTSTGASLRLSIVRFIGYPGNRNGLRNIKLSTNSTTPTLSDTNLGSGTEYNVGLQSNESETNLETEMSVTTTILSGDTLNIPFKYTNSTGSSITVNKLGLYDYNGGSIRLFSALLLNSGSGTIIPTGGFILTYYKLQLSKITPDFGYLTDFGIKAIIKGLIYGDTTYNINTIGFGSGPYSASNAINGLFATEKATSILVSEANKILAPFSHTNSSGSTEQVEEIGFGHLQDITADGVTFSSGVANPINMYDDNSGTYSSYGGQNEYCGKLFSSLRKIKVVKVETYTGYLPECFAIEYSINGINTWVNVQAVEYIDDVLQVFVLDIPNCKAIRLRQTDDVTYNKGVSIMEIHEFNLFSKFAHSETILNTETYQNTYDTIIAE